MSRGMQRVGIALALAGILAMVTPHPSTAALVGNRFAVLECGGVAAGRSVGGLRQDGFWMRAMDWLAGWWGGERSGPQGPSALWGEEGAGIDPLGSPWSGAPGTSATSGAAAPTGD
jgi:hypothetical protein